MRKHRANYRPQENDAVLITNRLRALLDRTPPDRTDYKLRPPRPFSKATIISIATGASLVARRIPVTLPKISILSREDL